MTVADETMPLLLQFTVNRLLKKPMPSDRR